MANVAVNGKSSLRQICQPSYQFHSSPSSNPSLDPRLDRPDLYYHFTFCLCTNNHTSIRSCDRESETFALSGRLYFWFRIAVFASIVCFPKDCSKISFIQRRQKKMVFQFASAWIMEFGIFYFSSAWYSR